MSLVPDVIDNLLALIRVSDDARIPGLQVIDGPRPDDLQQEYLAVGATPEDPTSTAVRVPAGLVATTASVDVPCWVRVWSGDLDLPTLRRRAYEIHDAVVDLVERDRSLAGACSNAEVTGSICLPNLVAPNGCVVDVTFTVRATRF